MNIVSIILIVARFVLEKLPEIIEQYRLHAKDTRYNNEAERIDAIITALKTTHGRGKLDHARELEK